MVRGRPQGGSRGIAEESAIRQTGNSIRVDYVNINNISVDYEITVPENTALRSHTGSGDQTIEGLKGNIDLESGSGDLNWHGSPAKCISRRGREMFAARACGSGKDQGGQRRYRS